MGTESTPLVCNLAALTDEARERHIANAQTLFAAVQETRELPDGYALRLPATSATLAKAAEFITYERLCCPFLRLGVRVEPDHGPIWLELTGNNPVKAYLTHELACALPDRA